MISCGFGIDNIKDTLAGYNEAVTEALAFGCVFTRWDLWVMAFVVARKVADNVRVLRLGENERRGIMRFEFLSNGCEIRQREKGRG